MNHINFLQVGRTIECSNCHPDKGYYSCEKIEEEYKLECKCICHQVSNPKEEKPKLDMWEQGGHTRIGEKPKECCQDSGFPKTSVGSGHTFLPGCEKYNMSVGFGKPEPANETKVGCHKCHKPAYKSVSYRDRENFVALDLCKKHYEEFNSPESKVKPEAWVETFLSKFFVYRLGGKFPDHVGAEKEAVGFIKSLLKAERERLLDGIKKLLE